MCLSYCAGIFLFFFFSQTETLAPLMSPHSYSNIHTHTHPSYTQVFHGRRKTHIGAAIIFVETPKKPTAPSMSVLNTVLVIKIVLWQESSHCLFWVFLCSGDSGQKCVCVYVCVRDAVKKCLPQTHFLPCPLNEDNYGSCEKENTDKIAP